MVIFCLFLFSHLDNDLFNIYFTETANMSIITEPVCNSVRSWLLWECEHLCVESNHLIYSDRVLSGTVGHRTAAEGPTSAGQQIRYRQSLPWTHQRRENHEGQHQERETHRTVRISGKSNVHFLFLVTLAEPYIDITPGCVASDLVWGGYKRWTFSDSMDFIVCSIRCVYCAELILDRYFIYCLRKPVLKY